MAVQTVLGKINPSELGIVLTHEHVVLDRAPATVEPEEIGARNLFHSKLTMDKLGIVKRNPLAILDNLQIMDENSQVEELMQFKYAGGKTVVDVTSGGVGRDPQLLRRVALKTGLNIIAGAGYYIESFLPKSVLSRTVAELEEEIIKQVTVGFDHTDIIAGVIGEIGVSRVMTPFEENSLTASCRAHARTGVPLSIHVNPWAPAAFEAMEVIEAHSADPEKVTICHVDLVTDEDFLIRLLDKGVFLEFDNFSREVTRDLKHCTPEVGRFLPDWDVLRMIKKLIDRGYGRQILLSMDICLKHMLRAYGGVGYAHVIANLVPMMKELGITQAQIDEILIHNPARWLNVK